MTKALLSAALFLAWVLADPPPGDACRLPPEAELRRACYLNARYQDCLRQRMALEPLHRADLRAALDEAAALHEIWDDAWDAHPDYGRPPGARREYLRRLRLALGRDAYLRMELPPPVPVWRFNQLER